MQSASSVTSIVIRSGEDRDSTALVFTDQHRESRNTSSGGFVEVSSNLSINEHRGSQSECDTSSGASQDQDNTLQSKKMDSSIPHDKIPVVTKWTWGHRQKSISPIVAKGEEDLMLNTNASSNNTSTLVGAFFSSLLRSNGNSHTKPFRAKEELCAMLPGHEKVWYLREGFIGREIGTEIFLTTNDPSMDPFHARVTLQGDDYLIRDNDTTNGTYLCLSTLKRHQPQRHGFRLKPQDVIFVGERGRIVINELHTIQKSRRGLSHRESKLKVERRLTDMSHLEQVDLDKKPKKVSFEKIQSQNDPFGLIGRPYVRTKNNLKINKPVQPPVVLENNTSSSPSSSSTVSISLGDIHRNVNNDTNGNALTSCGSTFQEHIPLHLGVMIYSYPTTAEEEAIVDGENIHGSLEARVLGRTLDLGGQQVYTIGSSPKCDIQVQGKGIRSVHARIVFDGLFFVLQDLSFEADVKLKTRVLLSRPVRIEKGDLLLLGKSYVLCIVNKSRAFDISDEVSSKNHNNNSRDVLDVALKCQLLRTSKRKKRQRTKFSPVIFALPKNQDIRVGKHSDCEVYVRTATMCAEQFRIRYDSTGCTITPSDGSINQGLYLLLGRRLFINEQVFEDSVQFTSKALILDEGTIFRCGGSEIEAVYIKNDNTPTKSKENLHQKAQEIRENVQLLKSMPWLEQIAMDRATIENLAQHAIRLSLDIGATIYNTGDPAGFLFLVLSGEVTLFYTMDTTNNSGTSPNSNQPNDQNTSDLMEMDAAAKATAAAMAEATAATVSGTGSRKTSLSGYSSSTFERVPAGSFFGEVCLFGNEIEYRETARAFSPTVLLIFNREDLNGYMDRYMDILMSYFTYEKYKPLLCTLRSQVSLFKEISYQDLRKIANQFEKVTFKKEEAIFQDGKLTKGFIDSGGIVVFLSGTVDVKPPSTKRHSNIINNHQRSSFASNTTAMNGISTLPESSHVSGRNDENAYQHFEILMDCQYISKSTSTTPTSLDGNTQRSDGDNDTNNEEENESEEQQDRQESHEPSSSTDDTETPPILQSVPVTSNVSNISLSILLYPPPPQ
jgi:pSer/pThr/pTyr-binding forkhead associated (FHA) protein/CRP-like cAMP-binding protein